MGSSLSEAPVLESHVEGMRAVEVAGVGADGVVAGEDAPSLAGAAAERRVEVLAESVGGAMSGLCHIGQAQKSVAAGKEYTTLEAASGFAR